MSDIFTAAMEQHVHPPRPEGGYLPQMLVDDPPCRGTWGLEFSPSRNSFHIAEVDCCYMIWRFKGYSPDANDWRILDVYPSFEAANEARAAVVKIKEGRGDA